MNYDTPYRGVTYSEATAWVGWVIFAAVMLLMLGAFQIVIGLVSLFSDGFFLVHHNGQLVPISFTAWGWIHLTLATVAIVTGLGLMLGQTWARIVGTVLASLNVVVSFVFIDSYPWWAVTLMLFSIITVYAIAVHGGEVARAYEG